MRLILLDEPTVGVDESGKEIFDRHLQKKKEQGAAILIASENMTEIERVCDRILLLDTIGRNRTSLRHTAGKPGMPQADTCSLLELTAAVRAIPLKITETEADMPPEPAAGVRGNKILSALSRKSEKREKACRCGQLQC